MSSALQQVLSAEQADDDVTVVIPILANQHASSLETIGSLSTVSKASAAEMAFKFHFLG